MVIHFVNYSMIKKGDYMTKKELLKDVKKNVKSYQNIFDGFKEILTTDDEKPSDKEVEDMMSEFFNLIKEEEKN